ncbi:uncharacterized protein [Amphiura filiformis]|uniref:uncharacterized protein n=1 Tax=Amphiura filiformis TaxID=82378 RepID=UPI003B21EBB6
MPRLISVLKSSHIELLDLALSIVATCCREAETRKCVQKLQGIPILLHILKAQSMTSIINRASRAIANLAEDPEICHLIHTSKAIPLLVKLVNAQEDSNCRQSLVRALRMLADDDKHKWEVTKYEGVKALLPCIQCEDEALITCSIRALASLTTYQQLDKPDTVSKFLTEATRQVTSDPEHTKVLLQLLSHSKTAIKEQSLVVLVNLMPVDIFRVAIGNAEGIKIFVDETQDQTKATFPTFLHCLCCCCREAVNRAKVKELEGLSVLLHVLKSDTELCQKQHENVLSALLNFYYDEMSLKYLASLGFVEVLVKQLLSSISVKEKRKDHQHSVRMDDKKILDNKGSSNNENLKGNQIIAEKKLIKTPRKEECKSTSSSASSTKTDEKREAVSRPKTAPIRIPTPEPLPTDGGYLSDMSPESSSSNTGAMWSPGPSSTSYSPPHMDWSAFMSQRPRLVAPDVSPLSSTSFRSSSPPKYSPQWSPHWSPQWSPDYSPAWEPMWSPQSSPEHMVEAFQLGDEEECEQFPTGQVINPGCDDFLEAAEDPNQTEVALNTEDGVPPCSTSSVQSKDHVQSTSDKNQNLAEDTNQTEDENIKDVVPSCSTSSVDSEDNVQSTSDKNQHQLDVKILKMDVNAEDAVAMPREVTTKCEEPPVEQTIDVSPTQSQSVIKTAITDTADEQTQTRAHSTSETCNKVPFRTPDYSQMKSRSGKRKAKLKNTPTKTAKCLDFTPGDLPLDCAMSASPSHSSTCTSTVGDLETTPEHKGREHDALCMLSRYSHMDKPSQHLLKSEIITGLLDYWLSSPNPHLRCWRVLIRLMENKHCFEKLLLQRAPMIIHEKLYSSRRTSGVFRNISKGDGDEACQMEDDSEVMMKRKLSESDVEMENRNSLLYRMSSTAATKFGEGVMEHLLLVEDVGTQVSCVLAMPYLCRNPTYLKKMLIRRRGLDILVDYLRDNVQNTEDVLYSSAIVCLHDFANMKEVQRPLWDIFRERSIDLLDQASTDQEISTPKQTRSCAFSKHSTDLTASMVTFTLDDGSAITVDRELVIRRSEYFTGLLEGHYAEANQTRVPLRHISNSALTCIVHHLYECTPASCEQTRELLEESCDVAMETIATAGQFLLPRLQDMVSNVIVTTHLSPSSAVDLFGLGHLHSCQRLCTMCVLYLLCCVDVGREEFNEIGRRVYGDDIFEEMRSVLLNSMQMD